MKRIIIYICLVATFMPKMMAQATTEEKINAALSKGMSHHYSNRDSAYLYYEKIISLADKENNLEGMLTGFLYLINANGYHYDLGNYSKNLLREEQFLFRDKRLDTTLLNVQFYKDYLLFDKGNYNYKIKQYATSKKFFLELLSKIETVPKNKQTKEDMAMVSSLYSFLGLIYHHTGKYELASYTFNKDIEFVTECRDSISNWESRSNNSKKLLSQVFEEKNEFDKANDLLEDVLKFYRTKIEIPRFKNNIISTYIVICKNHIKQGNFKLALQKLKEITQYSFKDNPFDKEIDLLYGDAHLGLNNYDTALTYYTRSYDKTTSFRNNTKHQDLAIVYARLGKLYMTNKQIDKGLQQYQAALIQLQDDFNIDDINLNPNPEKVFSKIVLITILREKLNALFRAYTSTQNIAYLETAHETSKTIIATLDLLRPEFENKLDKRFLINETFPSIQTAVEVAYLLYESTGNSSYINDAFYFMEKSKSISLLEAQRNAHATKYGEVPGLMLNEEQQYRAKISHLEKQIFNRKQEAKPLTDSLFSLKSEYHTYLGKIEKEYPKYYLLKYQSEVTSLQKVKQHLQKNQALLSYLATQDYMYLVVADKGNELFYKFPFDKSIKETIENLHRKSSKIDIHNTSVYNDSRLIYKTILEKALVETNATDLFIIPDDILYYVPFEGLVTSDTQLSFLLTNYTISYANSATLLLEQNKSSTRKNNRLLIVAPEFNEDESPLFYNRQEAEKVAKYFNGTIYNEDESSIGSFNQQVNTHNLLHFATHASANDEFPEYSYLTFSNKGSEPDLLYAKDLYNYQLNADMVTLSACETGIGKLQKGEGMLSLATAFNYAGTSSIVTTLWKINDQSTSEIMGYFYENLDKGLSKKEALQNAKLMYLDNNEDALLKHPYYWSGIILTGNALPINTNNYTIWIVLGISIMVLVLIFKKSIKLIK